MGKLSYRAPAGYSKRLCHGCGKEGTYPHNQLCGDCKHKIMKVDELEQQGAELGAPTPYGIVSVYHDMKYIPHDDRGDGRGLQRILHELAFAVSEPTHERADTGDDGTKNVVLPTKDHRSGTSYRSGTSRLFHAPVVKLLNELLDKVIERLDYTYEEGKVRGRSILVDLARGDLSINKFEDSKEKR